MHKQLAKCDASSEESKPDGPPVQDAEELPEASLHSVDAQPRFERPKRFVRCTIEKSTKIIHLGYSRETWSHPMRTSGTMIKEIRMQFFAPNVSHSNRHHKEHD